MSYQLKVNERTSSEIKRIVREQVQKSIAELIHSPEHIHEAVHNVRKRFKKIRAVLRLVRPHLGDQYSLENSFYRDTAKVLSEARDAQAMLEAFDALSKSFPKENFAQFQTIRDRLQQKRDSIVADASILDAQVKTVVQRLHEALARIEHWPIKANGFKCIREGVQTTYSLGRDLFHNAYKEPTDEAFHEWRKQVKCLWYHQHILQKVWPRVMKAFQEELKRLSDKLGDDHDLAVMASLLQSETFAAHPPVEKFLTLLAARQKTLRRDAQKLGARIYAEKPKRMASRLGKWWKASGQ